MSDDTNKGISRRDALKLLGAVPLTGALHWTPEALSRATHVLQQDGDTAPDVKRKFFSAHEDATVRILVDMIIPRDERSGSATEARVPEFMDYMLAEASERNRVEMHGGLAWLDTECNKRFNISFVKCTDAQHKQVLDDISWPARARPEFSHGVQFFNSFRDLTASGFFSSQMGWKDVRYIGNVFNPNWNGCPPEALHQLGVSYDS
ncbi:MAG: gluconate 2-dehydrogenase subunit 3 family protein [Gemmatimonadaceae bacterium]